MIEENEEIVRAYFEAQGYLVKANVRYQDRASDRVMGWSDVDLVVQHPISGDAAAVEVKGWHTEAITPSYLTAHRRRTRSAPMLGNVTLRS